MSDATLSGILAIVFLLGAAQGLFLAAVLVSRTENQVPNRLLAALVFTFSLDLSMAVYHATGASLQFPALIGLDLPLGFLYGPLLYLYIRTLTEEPPRLTPRDAWHTIPFVATTLFLIPVLLLPGDQKLAVMGDPSLTLQTRMLAVVNPLKLILAAGYIGLIVARVRRYARDTQPSPSPSSHVRLRWLRTLTLGVTLLLTLSTILFLMGGQAAALGMNPSALYDDLTLLAVTVFVYAVGYLGLRQPEITAPPTEPVAEPTEAAYARSGMDAYRAAEQRARLLELMRTEHPYRQGDLTLQGLADGLGISSHNLTEVLSTQFGQSFYEFVNGYRVREVQERLRDPAFEHWTVLAIGMESGFNAKSSFNAAFKRHTGMTPSEYRRAQVNTT